MIPSKNAGFTLVEILVVIAIIGILMGLMFSVGPAMLDMGKRTSAQNDVNQIATAITAYEAEYGRLPISGTADAEQDVNGELLQVLLGENESGLNPREIVFLEPNPYKKNRGGVTNGEYRDPWFEDDGAVYKVALDGDYDNTLTDVGTGDNSMSELRKTIAVWSLNTNSRRQVVSW